MNEWRRIMAVGLVFCLYHVSLVRSAGAATLPILGKHSGSKRVYRAHGETDPVQAKQVVVALGLGKHVVVKFAGKELHGHIQAIEDDYFTVLPDREITPVQIPYSEVRYVEKNLTLGATIVLVVLIIVAAAIATSVAATR